MNTRLTVLCAACLACAALTHDASAQTDDARATAIFDEANRLYDQRKLVEAEAKYEEAWALRPSSEIATNLANVELVLGQTAEAASHLAHALRVLPASRDADRPKIEKLLTDAKAKVATVVVKTEEGATVTVDGKTVGLAPLPVPVFLMPGAHEIAAERSGRRGSKDVAATAGLSESIELQLAAAGTPETPPTTPPPDGETEDGGKSVPLLVGGSVLAATGVGLGIAFLAMSGSAASDRDTILDALPEADACAAGTPNAARCDEAASLDSDAGTFGVVGGVALGVGIAAGIGTLAYALWPSSEPATGRSTTVVPALSPTTSGLLLRSTF